MAVIARDSQIAAGRWEVIQNIILSDHPEWLIFGR
jgi:hypothetical protein